MQRTSDGVLSGSQRASDAPAAVMEVEMLVPDEVNHTYLEVREASSHTLVTMIEVLSLVNKVNKHGREQYIEKRDMVLGSRTNLVEIDLLRSGGPLPLAHPSQQTDYRILVSRGWRRPMAHLYTFDLPAEIPTVDVPLTKGEKPVPLALNQVLHDLYQRARFDIRIDYAQPPTPALTEAQQAWADGVLAKHSAESQQ